MNLTLRIIDSRNFDPSAANVKEFHQKGGSIGRADNNDLVLADAEKTVSKLHAFIHYRQNQYYLTDVSTNGVFFNEEATPVAQTLDNPRVIQQGDRVQIGHYLLQASLEEDVQAIVEQIQADKAQNAGYDIESLLQTGDDSGLLRREYNPADYRVDGRFGGAELHQHLGISENTREAKHVAGDLSIDDFLNDGFNVNTLPNNSIDDLLDLDRFEAAPAAAPQPVIIPQQTYAAASAEEILVNLAKKLRNADPAQRQRVTAELRRLEDILN